MEELKYSKILVPTDGSECSYLAAEHAAYLARMLGSKVYVINVVNVDMAFHSGIHYAEGVVELEQAGKDSVAKAGEILGKHGVECEELILKGAPADTILRVAAELCVDCIVIGSVGMSAIERALMGSVSEKVARHARCPVLLIRTK